MMKLVEAIKDGEIVRVSEAEAVAEDLFILRIVDEKMLEPKPTFVVEKKKEEHKRSSFYDSWRRGGEDFKKNNVINDLIPNFHWQVSYKRKAKNLSRRQLAEAVGFPEEDIKMLELGRLLTDDFVLISKVESHLGLNLRRNSFNPVSFSDLQKNNAKKEVKKDSNLGNTKELFGSDIELVD